MEEEEEGTKTKRRVCVTGAGGFAASWLVKLLLSKGFIVHGTVRDPGDKKNAHLKKLENATENLQLFTVDLFDVNSISAAIAGCEGVFHVASPVPASKVPNPEVEVISPAVLGTRNVLKASSQTKAMRVVVVSSAAAVMMNPNWRSDMILDESCWSDYEYCKVTENWYNASKTQAEREALEYAEKEGLDVVTVLPSLVIGPLLQSTVNASSLALINIIKGIRESIENKNSYIVDVRDVADALYLVYERPEASGRFICSAHRIKTKDLVDILKELYSNYVYPKSFVEATTEQPVLSSEKLQSLGWRYRPLKDTLVDAVEYYQSAGLLDG